MRSMSTTNAGLNLMSTFLPSYASAVSTFHRTPVGRHQADLALPRLPRDAGQRVPADVAGRGEDRPADHHLQVAGLDLVILLLGEGRQVREVGRVLARHLPVAVRAANLAGAGV